MSPKSNGLLSGRRVCETALALAVFALLPLAPAQAQNQGYTVTDLGPQGGSSIAYGINNNGQVAGEASAGVFINTHAVLWDAGTMTDLMVPVPAQNRSFASGINDAGQVAVTGMVDLSGSCGNCAPAAFVWSAGAFSPLFRPGGPPLTNIFCSPFAINSAGELVGVCSLRGATFWSGPGAVGVDVGTLIPGEPAVGSQAFGINNLGQIVGESIVAFPINAHHAFLSDRTVMQDLGTLPGFFNSRALGINDLGQVVGEAANGAVQSRAFLFDGGGMQDLGTLPGFNSTAFAINTVGQIVGKAWTLPSPTIAVLWEAGQIKRLGTLVAADSGWDGLGEARAINDAGQIAVYSGTALLLTPITVTSLSFNPNPVRGGNISSGTAVLTGKAPPVGVVVALSSSNPSVQVPASVTIAGGQTSATFPIGTSAVMLDTLVDITATVNGVDTVASLLLTAS